MWKEGEVEQRKEVEGAGMEGKGKRRREEEADGWGKDVYTSACPPSQLCRATLT